MDTYGRFITLSFILWHEHKKREMASNVIVHNKDKKGQSRSVNWMEKSRKKLSACVYECVCVCVCVYLCVCVHEYQIKAANKSTADFENDLMIEHSRMTDPLCIGAEECAGECMCVIFENKGPN